MAAITKQQGIVITAVLGLLLGCGGLLGCIGSLTYTWLFLRGDMGTDPLWNANSLLWIVSGACTSLGFVALPVVFYFLLVRGVPDDPPASMG